jgi:DNA adenine methylase
MSNATTSLPLKWHGGKHYMASKIVALMPPHTHYVEPYFGGGAVMFAKDPEGVSEVANDINGHLTNFWRVLQRPDSFEAFRRRCEATPFSEAEYRRASAQGHDFDDDPELAAWQFFVQCRQSLAGRMKSFAPLSRTRTRRGMNEQASAWTAAVDGLTAVHQRLRRVAILNHDATEVIRQQDGPATLFYCDPPYLAETRTAPDVYAHEMTPEQHVELLATLKACRGKVFLSGYRSALYDEALARWPRREFLTPNHSGHGATKQERIECLWESPS